MRRIQRIQTQDVAQEWGDDEQHLECDGERDGTDEGAVGEESEAA